MGPVSGRKVMERSRTSSVQGGIALAVGVLLLGAHPGWAADCSVTSIGFVPINDLGPALYLGQYQGGLYPGGSNSPPPAHFAEGRARALAIRPLDALGNPDPSGRIVLMSVGYSNATQEWCNGPPVNCQSWTFKGRADADSRVNHVTLDIVNGAKGGEPAPNWDEPTDANYDRILNQVLTPQGLTEAQVQIIWLKLTTSGPTISLPNSNAEAFQLVGLLADIVRTFRIRYPNIRMVFVSSRIYAGYAGYPVPMSGAHPEPYAYESGFSVKWLVQAQINQMATGAIDPLAGDLDSDTVAPFLAWGPYFWADGESPRSDGLQYFCSDIQPDGLHPAQGAQSKVGQMLHEFMLTSRFATPWFRRCELGDMNRDGLFNGRDVQLFVETFLDPAAAPASRRCPADCSDDGTINAPDLDTFISIMLGG